MRVFTVLPTHRVFDYHTHQIYSLHHSPAPPRLVENNAIIPQALAPGSINGGIKQDLYLCTEGLRQRRWWRLFRANAA